MDDSKEPAGSPLWLRSLAVPAIVMTLVVWPVGVVLLWVCGCWRGWQKWLATLVFPGGLPAVFFMVTRLSFTFSERMVLQQFTVDTLVVIAFLLPIGIAIYLVIALLNQRPVESGPGVRAR